MESVGDVCGGGGRRALASELARVQAMVRELEANMDRDLTAAARELCGELASTVDRSLRLARSWPPGGPESGDGGQQDASGTGNAGRDAQFKRRKGVPSVQKEVRVASLQDNSALEDGFSWRKYGQKDILAAKYPRAYFRCTHRHAQGCPATKQVQRVDGDPLLFTVVYHGAHTCVQAARAGAEQLQPGNAGQASPPALDVGGGPGFEPTTPSPFAPTALLSPTSMDWQLRSIQAAGGLGADMDFEASYQDLFSDPSESFQW